MTPLSRIGTLVFVLASTHIHAPCADGSDDVFPTGPGITDPHLLHKVEPKYTEEARTNRVEGTAILQIVITEQGRASDITVLRPLGFGLDESAQEAIAEWEFAPSMKEGKPVKVQAVVEAHFGRPVDEKADRIYGALKASGCSGP